jgi:hypothetical protein
MELQTPVNDGQAVDEGQQEEPIEQPAGQGEGNGQGSEPDAAPATQQPNKPAQTPEQNAVYRERRIKAERERDEAVEFAYGGQGIHTWEQLQAAREQQRMADEAAKRNMSAEDYAEWEAAKHEAAEAKRIAESTQKELVAYRQKDAILKEADNYAKHPKWGAFFAEHRDEIIAKAMQFAGQDGRAEDMIDYARMLVFNDKWEPPKPVDVAAIEADGVKKHLEALKKQNVPVETRGGGIPGPTAPTGDVFKNAELSALSKLRGDKI